MNVLNEDEAWRLFSKHADKVASLEHTRPCAKAVSRECDSCHGNINEEKD